MDNWNTRGTIKMGGHIIWITFVITAQFSAVLGRNSYYEYYYSRYHHKGHSTTAGLSSSTTGISADISDVSSEERTSSSVSGDTSLKNILHSLTVDLGTTVHRNTTLQGYGRKNQGTDQTAVVWIVIGAILFVLVLVWLLICCCRRLSRRVRKGIILSNNDLEARRVLSEQNLLNHAQPPNYTEEQAQQFPSYYQSPSCPTQPVLQLPYFPAPQFAYQHNPASLMQPQPLPESPPPSYDAPSFEVPTHETPPYKP